MAQITIDRYYPTGSSEYKSRNGRKVTSLQPHHAATTSLSTLLGLMMPGGRRVSANCALYEDELINVVPLNMRAFTSASSFDEISLTVEIVNSSGSPLWRIPEKAHRRLAKLLAEMHLVYGTGLYLGEGGMVPHNKVPGSYATACPGPSFNAEIVFGYAREYLAAWGGVVPTQPTPSTPKPTQPAASADWIRLGSKGDRAGWVIDRLIYHGYYKGFKNDKVFGPIAQRELKAFQRDRKLQVDGEAKWGAGNQSYDALAKNRTSGSTSAPQSGKILEDGIRGSQTIRRLQEEMNEKGITVNGFRIKTDGKWGTQTATGLQKLLGVKPDGNFGPVSILALQKRLNALNIRVPGYGSSDRIYEKGGWGNQTTKGLQIALNRDVL